MYSAPSREQGGESVTSQNQNLEGISSHHQNQTLQLTVLYYNAWSILQKLDELHAVILSQKPDLLCIVETWLCEDINDSELLLPGYQLYRLDCNRHGGGIMIYVCSSLSCMVLLRGGPFNLEFLAISVFVESSTIHFCKKFCICLFNRPPSSSVSIFDNLCTTLQIINPAYFSNFILIGDFNVDF